MALSRFRSAIQQSPWRLVGALMGLLLLAAAWTNWFDRPAAAYLEQSLQRTLATFAVARGANAAISLLKDADVSLTPVGVGLTISPGELLDPIDDLIEQLSTLLLWAATSLGIQRIALELSGSMPVRVLCSLATGLWVTTLFWPAVRRWRGIAARIFVLSLVLRWLVPTHALLVEAIDESILRPRFDAALAELTVSRDQANALGAMAGTASSEPVPSFSERMIGLWRGDTRLDLEARIRSLANSLASLGARVVELMVVFSLQTILLPLAFVWLSTWLLRVMLRASFRSMVPS